MVSVELQQVTKVFGAGGAATTVLQDLNLSLTAGMITAVRGDNGTGKTTILNLIAGVEQPTSGTVRFPDAKQRPRIGYTQQDYTSSLLPWFDVAENIALPLRLNGTGGSNRLSRVRELLSTLQFDGLPLGSYPHQLSGGQRQRVALARALIHDPNLLLLDEPFSNLDAHTSRDIQEMLSTIHQASRPTILYVAHDLDHSIYLADRILLLHGLPARIVQEFEVRLPRPRRRHLILTEAYAEIRSAVLSTEEALYAGRAQV